MSKPAYLNLVNPETGKIVGIRFLDIPFGELENELTANDIAEIEWLEEHIK